MGSNAKIFKYRLQCFSFQCPAPPMWNRGVLSIGRPPYFVVPLCGPKKRKAEFLRNPDYLAVTCNREAFTYSALGNYWYRQSKTNFSSSWKCNRRYGFVKFFSRLNVRFYDIPNSVNRLTHSFSLRVASLEKRTRCKITSLIVGFNGNGVESDGVKLKLLFHGSSITEARERSKFLQLHSKQHWNHPSQKSFSVCGNCMSVKKIHFRLCA